MRPAGDFFFIQLSNTRPILQQFFNEQSFIYIVKIICPDFFKTINSDRKLHTHLLPHSFPVQVVLYPFYRYGA